jgi:tetratricopeptide (TPR) repeat protein
MPTMSEKTIDTISRTARDQYDRALAALERNNLDYAIEMFSQCLASEPNFPQGRKFLRAAQMKRSELAGGFKRMFISAKLQPLLQKTRMAISKNPVESIGLAEQVLNEDPKNGQALILLAEASEAAQFLETTIQTLEHYLRLSPNDSKCMHWLARTYSAMERYDMALEVYERLLKANPSDFDAQKGIKDVTAHGAMQAGRWEQEGDFRKSLKDKDESVSLEQQSRVVRAEDMIENLIKETTAKLAQDPGNPVLQRDLGKLYGQKGDYTTALRYLETLLTAEAGGDPTLEREVAEIKAKQITTAITEKRKALAANPPNAPQLNEEIAALERQHGELLLKDAEAIVEKYPNDLLYRYDLAVLYMKTGNIQGAVEQFQRAVGQPQRRVASLNYLGQCFQQMGLHDLAIDQYLKAIEELPSMDSVKKDLTYNLGSAYDAQGDTEKAIAEYKKIAAVDFSFRDVRTKIMRRPPAK